jgi:hypothetical protein
MKIAPTLEPLLPNTQMPENPQSGLSAFTPKRSLEIPPFLEPICNPIPISCNGLDVKLPVTEAIADGNLVTAPAWPAHPRWLQEFLKVLGTKILQDALGAV